MLSEQYQIIFYSIVNLDGRTADGIAALLTDVYRDEGAALIVVTHSHELAGRLGAQWRLSDGALAAS